MQQRVKILECFNAEDIETKINATLDTLGKIDAIVREIELYPSTPNPTRTRVKIWYELMENKISDDVRVRAKELMEEATFDALPEDG